MIRKYLTVLGVAASYFVQAQDISVLKNAADVYSDIQVAGTSKSNAMAGALGALGGDISSVNSNPAGIGVYITNDLSLSLNIDNSKNTSRMHGAALGYSLSKVNLGQVGAVSVFQTNEQSGFKFFNLAVNYSAKSIENYVETPANPNIALLDNTNTPIYRFNGHAYNRTGNHSKISIAGGANYENKIYLGVSANLYSADIKQDDTSAWKKVSDGTIEYFNKQYTPYAEEASGASLNLGIIGKISQEFRLGLAVESPTWWKIDRTYQYYSKDGKSDRQYSESRNFISPLKTTISAAYVPSKNFALNVDYSLGLTRPKYDTQSKGVDTEFENYYKDFNKNQSEFRVGAEYRYHQFRLRGGYAYATKQHKDVFVTSFNANGSTSDNRYNNPISGERTTLAAGLGYDFKSFYIDAAFQHINAKYSNLFLYGDDAAESGYYSTKTTNNFSGDYAVSEVKNIRNILTFTLGWKF